MIKQLRTRFIIIATCATALVLFLIIGSINVINYCSISQRTDAKLQVLAENNGEFPEDSLRKPEEPMDKDNFDSHPENKNVKPMPHGLPAEAAFDTRYFTVCLNSDGTVTSVKTDRIAATNDEEASTYAMDLYSRNRSKGYISNYKYCRITTDDTETMYIFVDCERELSSFRMFLIASVSISLLGLFLVFLLLLVLSKKVVKPIAESYEKQKSFITNASHELKTPLTIIDANMEIIEMTHSEDEWTKSCRNQVKRLTDLTNKLVLLSRMDEESYQPAFCQVDFSSLIEEAVLPYEALAISNQKSLSSTITPNIVVNGDYNLLVQVISLLMDNALKYSTEHGDIQVSLVPQGHGCVLTIQNSASGISKGKHPEVFDRFYRGDESHSSITIGHGIGLSVVRAIISAHKGRVSAYSEDGDSFTISVIL